MKKHMVAVTGGIGSGKSTVCKIIRELGYTVLSADEIANTVLSRKEVKKTIAERFNLTVDDSGGYDRKELSNIVFNDKNALKWLNEYTHPKIMAEMDRLAEKEKGKIIFAEVPLLFESRLENRFDNVIIVLRDLDKRIDALKKRSGLTECEIMRRIKNQHNYEILPKFEHTILYNNSCLLELKEQVAAVIDEMVN